MWFSAPAGAPLLRLTRWLLTADQMTYMPARIMGADPRHAVGLGIGTRPVGATERDAFGAPVTEEDREGIVRAVATWRSFAIFGGHVPILSKAQLALLSSFRKVSL